MDGLGSQSQTNLPFISMPFTVSVDRMERRNKSYIQYLLKHI